MNENILKTVNEKINKITNVNLIELEAENMNFFDDIIAFKPYQVALILYACFTSYNVNLYDKIKLDDLCLNKICDKIASTINNKYHT